MFVYIYIYIITHYFYLHTYNLMIQSMTTFLYRPLLTSARYRAAGYDIWVMRQRP